MSGAPRDEPLRLPTADEMTRWPWVTRNPLANHLHVTRAGYQKFLEAERTPWSGPTTKSGEPK